MRILLSLKFARSCKNYPIRRGERLFASFRRARSLLSLILPPSKGAISRGEVPGEVPKAIQLYSAAPSQRSRAKSPRRAISANVGGGAPMRDCRECSFASILGTSAGATGPLGTVGGGRAGIRLAGGRELDFLNGRACGGGGEGVSG